MFRNITNPRWFRRSLLGLAFAATGVLTLAAGTGSANAQYYYPYYGGYPYGYGYPYYAGYYPYYGYPYGYGYGWPVGVSLGWGWGWGGHGWHGGGWGHGWHGGAHVGHH